MSSDAQIQANRENAKHSTGPTTDSGKAVSAQNARKHGFEAPFRVLPDEDREEYSALLQELRAEWSPITPTEMRLVTSMAQYLSLIHI